MIRLHVTAEGQTEQAFVRSVLAPHLGQYEVAADARCILTSKDKRAAREYRGGLKSYSKAKADILAWIRADNHSECRFTTMFDLYALPTDFPCYMQAKNKLDPYERVALLEKALAEDIGDGRFLPYIQLHEFETLILADPEKLDWEYLEHDVPIKNLIRMAGAENPELINDGRETSPSNRITREIPEYDKVSSGILVIERIGLLKLREKCRHFSQWIEQLEALGQ